MLQISSVRRVQEPKLRMVDAVERPAPNDAALCSTETDARVSETGAGEGIRTPDRLITNQVLYQLSYASAKQHSARRHAIATQG